MEHSTLPPARPTLPLHQSLSLQRPPCSQSIVTRALSEEELKELSSTYQLRQHNRSQSYLERSGAASSFSQSITLFEATQQTDVEPEWDAISLDSPSMEPAPLPVISDLPPISCLHNGSMKPVSQSEVGEALRLLTEKLEDPANRHFNDREALFWAAKRGGKLIVRMLLQGRRQQVKSLFGMRRDVWREPLYVDTKDNADFTVIQAAASCGQADIVQILLEHKASATERNTYNENALELAINQGHEGVIKVFVCMGTDLETTTADGDTPLNLAAAQGKVSICRWLLAGGADPEVRNHPGYTPLHTAAAHGDAAILTLLLEQEIDVDILDLEGRTAMHHAVASGKAKCVRILIREGASIHHRDSSGISPLIQAAKYGQAHMLTLLIQRGAHVDDVDYAGIAAIHWACARGHEIFVKQLLSKGANINKLDPAGNGVIYFAARADQRGILRYLIDDCGFDVDHKDADDRTPLITAAMAGSVRAVESLLQREPDIWHKDSNGESALAWSV